MSNATEKKTKPGNRWGAYYPWGEWFSKDHIELVKDRDFTCTLPGMTANIRAAAARMGKRVRIDQRPDRLLITVKEK